MCFIQRFDPDFDDEGKSLFKSTLLLLQPLTFLCLRETDREIWVGGAEFFIRLGPRNVQPLTIQTPYQLSQQEVRITHSGDPLPSITCSSIPLLLLS